MANDLNYTVNRKPKFTFDGEEFSIRKSVKIQLAIEKKIEALEKREKQEQKKIKAAEAAGEDYESDFNYTEEMVNIIFTAFALTVNKEFADKIEAYEPSEQEMFNLYEIIKLIRAGKTQEEAEKIVFSEKEEAQEKKV